MKVEIFYPFVDFRRLSSSKTDLLVEKPPWPKRMNKSTYYYRSMGQVYSKYHCNKYKRYTPSCIANGIRLKDTNIKGLTGINRVIDLKHDNDMFGFYSISFSIKLGTFSNKTINDIYEDFKKVKFDIVDLVDHYQNIGMEDLKGYLCKQYYWATRRLRDKITKKEIYQRDPNVRINGVNKIFILTQKEEMRDIHFLKPYFFLEYTDDDKLDDKWKKNEFSFLGKEKLSYKEKEKMRIVAIRRPYYDKKDENKKNSSKNTNGIKHYFFLLFDFLGKLYYGKKDENKKNSSKNTNNIKYNFLLFDYLSKLSNYKPTTTDDLVGKYFDAIAEIYYKEAYTNREFFKIQKIYEYQQEFADYTNTIIHQLTNSFGKNNLSNTLDVLFNNKFVYGGPISTIDALEQKKKKFEESSKSANDTMRLIVSALLFPTLALAYKDNTFTLGSIGNPLMWSLFCFCLYFSFDLLEFLTVIVTIDKRWDEKKVVRFVKFLFYGKFVFGLIGLISLIIRVFN